MATLARPPAPLTAPVPGRADPGAMTAAQFRAILASLQWHNNTLARLLACDESLVRKWAAGVTPVPPRVAYWLWSLSDVLRLHPPPAEWRTDDRPQSQSGARKGKSRAPARG